MKYRPLGQSGLEASVVAFGAWAVGGWFWGGADEQEAELLDIAPGTPVFRYERTLTLPDGRVAERDESVLRADRGRFRAEFMIPNSDAGGP